MFLPVIDRILAELSKRFSGESLRIMRSLAAILCPESPNFLNFHEAAPLITVYGEPCNVNQTLLKAEMTVASNLVKTHLKTSGITNLDLKLFLKLLTPTVAFPNLVKLIQIALTIPVTSASCERTFSAMKLIKTFLRNKTGDDRLSDLTTLFTSKERARCIDRDKVIEQFAERFDRRITFT
jgi:hypothetical protein